MYSWLSAFNLSFKPCSISFIDSAALDLEARFPSEPGSTLANSLALCVTLPVFLIVKG